MMIRFFKNHKIRIEISSSNFPQFDRNPNTGNEFGIDTPDGIKLLLMATIDHAGAG